MVFKLIAGNRKKKIDIFFANATDNLYAFEQFSIILDCPQT